MSMETYSIQVQKDVVYYNQASRHALARELQKLPSTKNRDFKKAYLDYIASCKEENTIKRDRRFLSLYYKEPDVDFYEIIDFVIQARIDEQLNKPPILGMYDLDYFVDADGVIRCHLPSRAKLITTYECSQEERPPSVYSFHNGSDVIIRNEYGVSRVFFDKKDTSFLCSHFSWKASHYFVHLEDGMHKINPDKNYIPNEPVKYNKDNFQLSHKNFGVISVVKHKKAELSPDRVYLTKVDNSVVCWFETPRSYFAVQFLHEIPRSRKRIINDREKNPPNVVIDCSDWGISELTFL
jgi:hypothetical protein